MFDNLCKVEGGKSRQLIVLWELQLEYGPGSGKKNEAAKNQMFGGRGEKKAVC